MSPTDSDSSDEEVRTSNIYLPQPHYAGAAPAHISNRTKFRLARDGVVKGKAFAKTVRFPDLYGPRDTIISNNTSNNSSDSGLEDLGDDPNPEDHAGGSNAGVVGRELPSFSANRVTSFIENDGDSDEEDNSDVYLENQRINSDTDESDDSDSENNNLTGPFQDQDINELDITDLNREEERGAFRNILRKMSLVDRANSDEGYSGAYGAPEAPSASDSFIGRVLAFSKDAGASLSGGGLVPGASHRLREPTIDEEMGITDNGEQGGAMEMLRLDFNNLDQEAQNLILLHVPNAMAQNSRQREKDKEEMNAINEFPAEGSSSEHSQEPEFYSVNPEREDEEEMEFGQDGIMLDDVYEDGYIARPKQVHAGVLSSLLRLYQNPNEAKSSTTFASRSTDGATLADSYDDNEYDRESHKSKHNFSKIKKGLKLATTKLSGRTSGSVTPVGKSGSVTPIDRSSDEEEKFEGYTGEAMQLPSFQNARPKQPKKQTVPGKKNLKKMKHHKRAQRLRITVHIADILQRQRFIMRMCRALMLFGAPTHRLEEYMVMTSRVLEIDGQFIYFPGCMIVAFGDAATRTSEVHLVRCAQGLNLSKLSDTHKIYKAVIHDLIGVEEAAKQLDALLRLKNLYPPWLCVLFYALGSSAVCPFAFGGGWIDVPIAFGVGLCVGYLQFFVSSKSNLYLSVFEVTASIVVAFISRAIGSIRGGELFCFSAIAQGSLALILPGYIILCGSLELQSRNLVAGSVRMFYAIIYSLFLGFGITLGGALYGWVDKNATSANTCGTDHSTNDKYRILFVPMFSLMLGLINQSRFRQLPIQTAISCTAYVGTYFAGKHFSQVTEFTACIGAFIVGVLGNLYLRVGKGMAVSAMLPAIFVQVPSGIASQSSLVSGIQNADQITGSNTTTTNTSTSSASMSFGVAMVEVAIGISVGLFAAALVVYPFGKKRTGLFTL